MEIKGLGDGVVKYKPIMLLYLGGLLGFFSCFLFGLRFIVVLLCLLCKLRVPKYCWQFFFSFSWVYNSKLLLRYYYENINKYCKILLSFCCSFTIFLFFFFSKDKHNKTNLIKAIPPAT